MPLWMFVVGINMCDNMSDLRPEDHLLEVVDELQNQIVAKDVELELLKDFFHALHTRNNQLEGNIFKYRLALVKVKELVGKEGELTRFDRRAINDAVKDALALPITTPRTPLDAA